MVGHPTRIVRVLAALVAVSCGGSPKPKKVETPVEKPIVKAPPPPETEEDREKKRHVAAAAIVPDGSACFPAALKDANAPRLELAAVGSDAKICAFDQEHPRLLGPVACWKIDLGAGTLAYEPGAALPGHSMDVGFDGQCARGYCLPKEAKTAEVAHIVWNLDGSKVAVLAGDDVHLFDAASKAHESSFSVRGDKGVSNEPFALSWVGDTVFVHGRDAGPYSAVWGFKQDGTAIGPMSAIGGKDKPISTFGGSFVVLDKNRIGLAERGFSTLNVYEVDSGKRSKINRKVGAAPCKADELEAYWLSNEAAVGGKCKDFLVKNYGHLVGADVVAGSKNFLALLRGPRLGELAVLDAKTLAEKKSIKLPWCDAAMAAEKDTAAPTPTTRGPTAKKKSEDPDQGGQ